MHFSKLYYKIKSTNCQEVETLKRYLVKLVDTNGVVSNDRTFFNRAEAETYMYEQEKKSRGWEMQIFEYPLTKTACSNLF